MALVGFDIGRAVKWIVIGVIGVSILTFIYSWYNRGVELTRTESQLAEARSNIKQLEDQVAEGKRIRGMIEQIDRKLDERREVDNTFYSDLSKNFDLGVQAELARQAEAAKTPPEVKVETTTAPTPSVVKSPVVRTTTTITTPVPPTPTPADNIGQLSIDAAWKAYCHAVNNKAENCTP